MAGQVWHTDALGGFMFAPNLSKTLRTVVQPRCKYRQFASLPDDEAAAKNSGDKFVWNVISDVATAGTELDEDLPMPKTNITITQESLTVTEYGNSVPYTGKLDDLSEQPVRVLVNKAMRNDAYKSTDLAAYAEFAKTPLVVEAAGGTSATDITIAENGTPTAANNVALGKRHVRRIKTQMEERNIPAHDNGDYYAIARPATYEQLKDDLENVQMYTGEGFNLIRNGEEGRYDGVRFIKQTNVPSKGWASGKSDEIIFLGDDAVSEGVVIPEEVRGKIPDDYGRGKGIAWYYLGGFGICRTTALDGRILKWGSTG